MNFKMISNHSKPKGLKATNTTALKFYPDTFHFSKKATSISQSMQTLSALWLICEISKTRAQMANVWKQKNFSQHGSFMNLQKHKPKRLILNI